MIQHSEYTDTCSLPNLFFPQQIFQPFVIRRQWGQPLFPSPPFSIAVGVILVWGSLSFFLMLVRLSFPFCVSWLVSLLIFLYRFTKLSILTVCDQILFMSAVFVFYYFYCCLSFQPSHAIHVSLSCALRAYSFISLIIRYINHSFIVIFLFLQKREDILYIVWDPDTGGWENLDYSPTHRVQYRVWTGENKSFLLPFFPTKESLEPTAFCSDVECTKPTPSMGKHPGSPSRVIVRRWRGGGLEGGWGSQSRLLNTELY